MLCAIGAFLLKTPSLLNRNKAFCEHRATYRRHFQRKIFDNKNVRKKFSLTFGFFGFLSRTMSLNLENIFCSFQFKLFSSLKDSPFGYFLALYDNRPGPIPSCSFVRSQLSLGKLHFLQSSSLQNGKNKRVPIGYPPFSI